MFSLKHNALMFAVAAGLAVSGAAGAHAQQGDIPSYEAAQPGEITDAKLQQFAKAEAAVKQIETQFDAESANAGSGEALASLQQQAGARIAQAIESNGLNVQEYNAIASAVRSDAQVQARYQGLAR